MRDQNDIVTIDVISVRHLSVDMELLEYSPRFRSIVDTIKTTMPLATELEIRNVAVRDYLMNYILDDEFPHKTPGTTGPGAITQAHVEVR